MPGRFRTVLSGNRGMIFSRIIPGMFFCGPGGSSAGVRTKDLGGKGYLLPHHFFPEGYHPPCPMGGRWGVPPPRHYFFRRGTTPLPGWGGGGGYPPLSDTIVLSGIATFWFAGISALPPVILCPISHFGAPLPRVPCISGTGPLPAVPTGSGWPAGFPCRSMHDCTGGR
jgi:hypothetical protein